MQVFISAQTGGLCVRVQSEDGDCDQDYLPWEEILSHLDRERVKGNRVKMKADKPKGCM